MNDGIDTMRENNDIAPFKNILNEMYSKDTVSYTHLDVYKRQTSRKSQEHWDYAQSIAPNIFIGIGKTLGLVEIVLCISLLLLNISTQTTVFAGVVVGIIFLIFGFYKTETGITSKFANKNF